MSVTGGCQCGAVRYAAESLGASSICHCRMCQKATGGFFGPYVDTPGLTWTRGQPSYFASSKDVKRGFCAACGTPLTFESHGQGGVMIGTLDEPEAAPPTTQLVWPEKLAFVDRLGELAHWKSKAGREASEEFAAVASRQDGGEDR
ncbi:GFA family protein [Phenylobacterium sp. J367]|uniref:GFA family protein n=1 Tax=Phenylobacterium sp. J367 TaxID=2898435 RepID=UPI002150A68D|nr:GFA family protein [Phenylobacterium sp. J367]MCR5878217.1 GFA family protein [Phenylobacterium sp. J367]